MDSVHEQPDAEVVEEYIAGSEQAFGQLVSRHMKSVYGLAMSITHSKVESEDITQDTFVKLWKNIKKYKNNNNPNNFKSWLLMITRNTAYDYIRKRKNPAFSEFDNAEGENILIDTLASAEPEAEELIVTEENRTMVVKALDTLTPAYREILALRYGQDLTFEEISAVVEKPLNTVKSQHRRALIKLRGVIAP